MKLEDEDRFCFIYHYYLSDESARKLSQLIKRAGSTTNKEAALLLMSRADSVVYKEYLA